MRSTLYLETLLPEFSSASPHAIDALETLLPEFSSASPMRSTLPTIRVHHPSPRPSRNFQVECRYTLLGNLLQSEVSKLWLRRMTSLSLPPPRHAASLANASRVFAIGANADGQCGVGSLAPQPELAGVAYLEGQGVAALACGSRHSLAVAEQGWIFAFGSNENGQLGLGTTVKAELPQVVPSLSSRRFASVAAGDSFSLALDDSGMLWGWGANEVGQLGQGDVLARRRPVPVAQNIALAAAGFSHALAFTRDGEVIAWGRNDNGQAGAPRRPVAPSGAGDEPSRFAAFDRSDRLRPQQLSLAGPAADDGRRPSLRELCGGLAHSAALSTMGSLWVWGEHRPLAPARLRSNPALEQNRRESVRAGAQTTTSRGKLTTATRAVCQATTSTVSSASRTTRTGTCRHRIPTCSCSSPSR